MTALTVDEIDRMLGVSFEFTRQPDPTPAYLRPERRVPLLLLLVDKSHGAGASWKGLQLLNWLVRDRSHLELFLAIRQGNDIPNLPVVRFEPVLDRAVDLAIGLAFLRQKSPRVFQLTDRGRDLVRDVKKTSAFSYERELLDSIDRKLTQKEITRVLEWRQR